MPPKINERDAKHGFDNVGDTPSGSGEQEAAELERAGVGSLVTIELLDTGKVSQFLITQNERNPGELPSGVRARLPEGCSLAHVGLPLARAVIGKTTEDEGLEFVVAKRRPLKIIEVKTL